MLRMVVSVLGNHDYTYYMHIDDNDQLAEEMKLGCRTWSDPADGDC